MSDFPTSFTLDFVKRKLPPTGRRILEIGSGAGRLARALLDLGYDVLAIDPDESAVAAAREIGVPALQCAWPEAPAEVSGFDAVLFTRSLHHIHPLGEAVERARAALTARGSLIVEDFAYDEVDSASIGWFSCITRVLLAAGVSSSKDEWLRELAASDSPLDVWAAQHDHDLHPFRLIGSAVRQEFGEVEESGAAYFFRYLGAWVDDPHRRRAIEEAVAASEESLASTGTIRLLGRRLVAKCLPPRASSLRAPRGAAAGLGLPPSAGSRRG